MIGQEIIPLWFARIFIMILLTLMFLLLLMYGVKLFMPNNKICYVKDVKNMFLLNSNLKDRYEELINAVNNNMSLSFFWLAGSIIEGVLCEYCKNNNIQSSKKDIDGYITALDNNKIIPEGSAIYTTLQYFRQFRNTIHPDNKNNDFINGKNLQIHKEELDNIIKYFTNNEALEALKQKNDNNKKQENTNQQKRT